MSAALLRFLRDHRGVALTEFAYLLPLLTLLSTFGAEYVNFITVRMRVSQAALHVADSASRMGAGSILVARRLSEADIDDILTGAGMQAGGLSLYGRGRVILSSLEPMNNPNTSNRFRIRWQRCRGTMTHMSSYGVEGDTNLTGMGPTGRQVRALDNNATMFVEIAYAYEPLFWPKLAPSEIIYETASMTVRERRDLTQLYPSTGVTASTC